jgi:hypothetical protein
MCRFLSFYISLYTFLYLSIHFPDESFIPGLFPLVPTFQANFSCNEMFAPPPFAPSANLTPKIREIESCWVNAMEKF